MAQKNEKRQAIKEQFRMFMAVTCVGIAVGIAASAFYLLLNVFVDLFLVHRAKEVGPLGTAMIIIAPALGGLVCAFILNYLAPDAKGGVGDVIDAILHRSGKIRGRVSVFKALAAVATIGSGGSAGREGPVVQIGASVASTLAKLFSLSPQRARTIVACGVAAGVSAVFNTPIAGVLFAAEIILGSFETVDITLLLTASVVGTTVARLILNDHTAFTIPTYSLTSPWEIVFSLFLGVLCAFFAEAFTATLHFVEEHFERMNFSNLLKPALGGLLVGVIGFWIPEVFGTGTETLEKIFTLNMAPQILLLFLFGKMLATSLTLGSGGSGGDLMPSLFLGGAIGSIFGSILPAISPLQTMSPSAYAVIGAAALFAAISRAPLTAIALGFEMGSNHGLILPLLLANAASVLVASLIRKESLYTFKLHKQGVDVARARKRQADPLHLVDAGEVMHVRFEPQDTKPTSPFCFEDDKLDAVLLKMEKSGTDTMSVLSQKDKSTIIGLLQKSDILKAYPVGRERLN